MLHNQLIQLVMKHQDETMCLASQLPPLWYRSLSSVCH